VAGEERHPTALRLRSPTLKKQAGLDQVGSILDAVKGMNAKALASLVVMINASDMTANEERREVQKVCMAFVAFEKAFDLVMPPSRQDHAKCKSNAAMLTEREFTLQTALDGLKQADSKRRLVELLHPLVQGQEDRRPKRDGFFKLNLTNIEKQQVIEFRQHPGTVDPEKAKNWIELLLRFAQKAKAAEAFEQAPPEKSATQLFLHMMQTVKRKELTRYYWDRILELDGEGRPRRNTATSEEERKVGQHLGLDGFLKLMDQWSPRQGPPSTEKSCVLCMEDFPVEDGAVCQGAAKHFTCDDCLLNHTRAALGADLGERTERNGCVLCPFSPMECPVENAAFTDAQLARHLPNEAFAQYVNGRRDLIEQRLAAENDAQMEQARRAEIQRLAQLDERERRLLVITNRIAQEHLQPKCPRPNCRQAYIDHTGCAAIWCSRCNCGFCGWCEADCGNDAHAHCRVCPELPAGVDAWFPAQAAFDNHWNRRKAARVRRELEQLNQEDRQSVMNDMRVQLADIAHLLR